MSQPARDIQVLSRSGEELFFLFSDSDRRDRIERALGASRVGVLFYGIENFFAFHKVYGDPMAEVILSMMERALTDTAGARLAGKGFVFVERLEPGNFAVLFPMEGMEEASVPDLALSVRLAARNALNLEVEPLTGRRLDLCAGHALTGRPTGLAPEQTLYHCLCDAREIARNGYDPNRYELMREFREVLDVPLLRVVYQPIVDFRSWTVVGWESLVRGPAGSHFESPLVLFDFAEEAESVFALERICRELAVANIGPRNPEQKIFINVNPRTLADPGFRPEETLGLLAKHGMSPQNVVLEITERHNVCDFALFHRALDLYREQGFLVAIDDVGAGYSGLWSIAEIRPEFIKVDMSLIRGIDTNPVKRAMIETLVTFADKTGSRIIAEGIETETEMSSLVSMGVHHGQGYYLGRPSAPKQSPVLNGRQQLAVRGRVQGEWKCSIPVSELLEPAVLIPPDVEVREVRRLLEASGPITGLVVGEGKIPIGLVMSHHLDRQLGTYFGVALYYQRGIRQVMDSAPLIVERSAPVEIVAKQAMERERFKIYDHIIVTSGGEFCGIVSVQKMLDTLARVQVEMAKGANPLTGMPGNLAIEREMHARAQSAKPMSLVYVDLDRFKLYNDLYGFKDGDAVILRLSQILNWAVKRHGAPGDFLGHVGGDDFVIITEPSRAERISLAVVRCFKRLVRLHYNPEDLERGYVVGKDRSGNEGKFDFVSVSLAIVDCLGVCDFEQIERRAAEVKHYAKTKPGNKYVRDRRAPLPMAQAPARSKAEEPAGEAAA